MSFHDSHPDTVQCQVIGVDKKRCTRKGTHSGGAIVRCEYHHQKYLSKKANDFPIERKKK